MRRTGRVVALPMLLELATAIAVVWVLEGALTWAGLALLTVVWASTGLWQVPAHRRLEDGFDTLIHRRLVDTNWVRTGYHHKVVRLQLQSVAHLGVWCEREDRRLDTINDQTLEVFERHRSTCRCRGPSRNHTRRSAPVCAGSSGTSASAALLRSRLAPNLSDGFRGSCDGCASTGASSRAR